MLLKEVSISLQLALFIPLLSFCGSERNCILHSLTWRKSLESGSTQLFNFPHKSHAHASQLARQCNQHKYKSLNYFNVDLTPKTSSCPVLFRPFLCRGSKCSGVDVVMEKFGQQKIDKNWHSKSQLKNASKSVFGLLPKLPTGRIRNQMCCRRRGKFHAMAFALGSQLLCMKAVIHFEVSIFGSISQIIQQANFQRLL